jgi:phosphohistidine phosphatase
MKTLYVVRHAKSSWDQDDLIDFDRPLNERGIKNAPEMAKRLINRSAIPQLILSSPANRAISTARIFANEMSISEDKIKQESSIYEGTRGDLARLISRQNPDFDILMLTGHNPGVTDFINWICYCEEAQIPTCSIATIQVDSKKWNGWERGMGKLIELDFPKKKK